MKKELEARLHPYHFRPSSEQQVLDVEILAGILFPGQHGGISKLLRLAVDELLERHEDKIEAGRPLYAAKREADAALAALRE